MIMREYYYLIAGLPMLEFGMKMPFSYKDFVLRCQGELCSRDMDVIRRATIAPCEQIDDALGILREWKNFDLALRNEIAKTRAIKKRKDSVQYIRGESYLDPYIAAFIHWAVGQDSPLEAERALDRLRWDKLEESGKSHYFDIDFIVIYALKLQILERWERINSEGGMEILQGLIA